MAATMPRRPRWMLLHLAPMNVTPARRGRRETRVDGVGLGVGVEEACDGGRDDLLANVW
jgi:hypothetical protein